MYHYIEKSDYMLNMTLSYLRYPAGDGGGAGPGWVGPGVAGLGRTGAGSAARFLSLAHLIRSINDPEHPLTLEELNVVELPCPQVNDAESTVSVAFTPTIPHCSMATLIGLSIKVKLIRSLPERKYDSVPQLW
uniref:Cytosolic iron-sulfur assembly component 2B n=1 Tax=Nothoprocta perdicaria TaxID=30464 RepID=A0A8C6YY91_NOTPE